MKQNRILQQLEEYLAYKHSLGFKLESEESVLRSFVRFTLENNYDGPLIQEIIFKWISTGKQSNKTRGRKIEVLRPFSKYVAMFDDQAEIIYDRLYKNVHDRPVPYIYTEEEVIKLMKQCETLHSPDRLRSRTIATIIGLLWSTGLRPSEPTNLINSDINFQDSVIYIRETKFSKERYVPIDDSVCEELFNYKNWIEQKIGIRFPEDAFFYTTDGRPMTQRSLTYAFKKVRPCIHAKPVGYPNVRLYDFRHTMACRTIYRWSEQKIDVNANLYVLSTYLGHVKPQDTYWYLEATPEILALSCSNYEEVFGGEENES